MKNKYFLQELPITLIFHILYFKQDRSSHPDNFRKSWKIPSLANTATNVFLIIFGHFS